MIYPTINGGMHRCFHIISELSKHCKVTMIIFQDKASLLKCIDEYPSIRDVDIISIPEISKDAKILKIIPEKIVNAFLYRWYKKRLLGPADGLFVKYYPVLKHLLKNNSYDIVLLENLASLNAVDTIKRFGGKSKIVYDAHNVESNLGIISVEKFGMNVNTLREIQTAEQNLYNVVDAVITCSNNDKNEFSRMNKGKLTTFSIPNGIEVKDLYNEGVKRYECERIIFCGSLWSLPNSEGLLWFYEQIWPLIRIEYPLLKLLVIGSGKPTEELKKLMVDSSIEFLGIVDNVKQWYNEASLSIVPLLSGSGTRLKILEAMSLGVPIVSTTVGAEGLEYSNEENILIADSPEAFSTQVIKLLNDYNLRLSVQSKARELVKEKYEWGIIGKELANVLETIL